MRKGCINWNGDIRYNQTTKIIERFLADLKASKQTSFWLEECNVCASCTGIEGVGGEWTVQLPRIGNTEFLTQADIMFDAIYSGKFSMPVTGDGLCENEVPQNLARAVGLLSTAKADYREYHDYDSMSSDIIKACGEGKASVISYRTSFGGGHFICIATYDDSTDEFICYDSWPSNGLCRNGGIRERYSPSFFKDSARLRAVVIYKKN